ncbi:MAG: adenosine kinase [archaeon]|nr:adenosine kinase [Nanoarchaeota archaeon]
MSSEKTNDVIGLGNTLMDMLIEVGEEKFLEFNLRKGEMHLVDEKKAKEILDKIKSDNLSIKKVPGGCSSNTLKGIAFLGGGAILCGKVGDDEHGEIYVQEISNHKVQPRISKHSSCPTGHAITFITPDTERTFSTHLGAAIELAKEDIFEEDIQKSKILHLEGYQIEGPTKETIMHAVQFAKKHGTLISIDLADPFIIRNNKEFLEELVMNSADIVFVNEKEALEYTGLENEEEAVRELGKHVKIAIVKLGEKGSLIFNEGKLTKVAPFSANAVDTTGAGDTFAAGFLYGYCKGWSLEKCGNLGAFMAAKIVENIGVRITELDLKDIENRFFVA